MEQSNTFNESEMALFNECMLKCAQKLLDTADIVREAIFLQLTCYASRMNPRQIFSPPSKLELQITCGQCENWVVG